MPWTFWRHASRFTGCKQFFLQAAACKCLRKCLASVQSLTSDVPVPVLQARDGHGRCAVSSSAFGERSHRLQQSISLKDVGNKQHAFRSSEEHLINISLSVCLPACLPAHPSIHLLTRIRIDRICMNIYIYIHIYIIYIIFILYIIYIYYYIYMYVNVLFSNSESL